MNAPLYWRLVKFGFRLLYNEMAFTYDAVSWIASLGEWREWQRAALKHLNVQPDAHVLELAHGTGNLQLDLRAAGLPFADASFPAIVSTFPTNFVFDPKTIAEVYRVLQPGGRFVFVPNGELSGRGLVRRMLEFTYRVTGQRSSSPARIEDRFEAVGFAFSQIVEPCRSSKAEVIIAQKPI